MALGRQLAVDLKLTSAQRLVHGETLYPTEGRAAGGYPYPPLWAFLVTPLLLLPAAAAEYSAAVICVVLMLAALWIVGTRDPACYAIALWSVSVVALARMCNASALVAPLIALGYRWNSAPTGIAVALKLYAWPLLLWGGITRGRRDLVIGIGAAAAAIFVPWAAIGFDGVTHYVSVARGITEATQGSTYALPLPLSITITALALAGMWVRRRDPAGSLRLRRARHACRDPGPLGLRFQRHLRATCPATAAGFRRLVRSTCHVVGTRRASCCVDVSLARMVGHRRARTVMVGSSDAQYAAELNAVRLSTEAMAEPAQEFSRLQRSQSRSRRARPPRDEVRQQRSVVKTPA